jgi:predicted RND superfamily exporter protein
MLEKFLIWTSKAYKRPLPIVVAAALVTVAFAFGIPKLKFDSTIRSMMPASNRDLVIHDYYEDENRFGKSDMVIVGIDTEDAYSVRSLEYVKKIEDAVNGLNLRMPASNYAVLLGITEEDGAKVIDALRGVGINEMNYGETLVPLITSAENLESSFGWDKAFAEKVANAAAAVPNKMTLYEYYENPIRKTQSILSADYIANEDDSLVVKKLVDGDAVTDEAVAGLRERVASWDLYRGAIVSDDGKLASVLVSINTANTDLKSRLNDEFERLLKDNADPSFKTYLDGEPVIESLLSKQLIGDIAILIPLVVVMVLGILFLCFRNVQAVTYPALIILFSVVSTVGLMSFCGIPMSLVGTTIPVLLVAIVSAYGIHQMNHYFLAPESDKLGILNENMKSVGLAILLSGITVMIGFGALTAEQFIPIRNFGIFTAIGDFIGILGALYVLPALILVSRKPKTVFSREIEKGWIWKLLKGFQRLNKRHSGLVLAATLALCAVAAVGATQLVAELNNVSFFKKGTPIHRADDHLNEKLAGTEMLNLVFDSDLSDPAKRSVAAAEGADQAEIVDIAKPGMLNEIERFSADVRKEFPFITKINSFNDPLKKMNQEMNGGDPSFYAIPQDSDLISQYLMIFTGDVGTVLTPNHDKLRVCMTMKRVSTAEIQRVREWCEAYFGDDFLKANHVQMKVTGMAHLYNVANNLLVDGMIMSIILCVLIVFVLLVVVLRDLRMSVIAMLPILVTMLLNFGLMGALKIPLNVATAIVSSIAIGIGVDYSIHFITWYRNELRAEGDIYLALEHTINRKGRGILYNMFVIFGGFIVLSVSKFVPLIQFGSLVALCTVFSAVGALAVVPAIIGVLAKKDYEFLYLGTRKERAAK